MLMKVQYVVRGARKYDCKFRIHHHLIQALIHSQHRYLAPALIALHQQKTACRDRPFPPIHWLIKTVHFPSSYLQSQIGLHK